MRRGPAAPGRLVRSLRIRNCRIFLIGHSISVTGTSMQRVAQDWLVLQITNSAVALGIAAALQFAPMLFFGLWGGTVADRVDRRRLIILTQSIQLVLALVLGLLAITIDVQLWMVYLLALLLGLVTVADVPARQSFVTDLVGPEDYLNAQALVASANSLSLLVGPAVAGLVIAAVDVGPTFLINTLSFVAMLIALIRLNRAELHTRRPTGRRKGQVREGFRYVWSRPELRGSILLVLTVSVLGQNMRVVLPVMASQTFQAGPEVFGYLIALTGAGALVAALFLAGRTTVPPRVLISASLAFALANIAMSGSTTLTIAYVTVVAVGVSTQAFHTLARAFLLLNADRAMSGRVLAAYSLVNFGSIPIGGPLLGWMCQSWGVRATLLVSGVCMSLVAFTVRRPLLRPPGHPGEHHQTNGSS